MAMQGRISSSRAAGRKAPVQREPRLQPGDEASYPFTNKALQPFPQWGVVLAEAMDGRSNYYGWENSFTRRFSDRWQANATYSLSWYKDTGGIGGPSPYDVVLHPNDDIRTELVPIGFDLAPDLRQDYQYGSEDQRHRATLNGIWEMGMGFQLSGLYFFGSASASPRTGRRPAQRRRGGTGLRPAFQATVAPRSARSVSWASDPARVDVRLTKRQRRIAEA
jgi:hypothetical protein